MTSKNSGTDARFPSEVRRLICLTMVTLSPIDVAGQGQARILTHDEYCKQQQATLATSSSGPKYLNAISNIPSCRSFAAKSLVAQWNRTHNDAVVLELLGRVSPTIRDQDVFEVTARVASNVQRSRMERLSAFAALAGYYDPTIVISYTDRMDEPGLPGFSYIWLGHTDAMATQGVNPLPPDTRGRVLGILAEAARSGADPIIHSIALFLSKELPRIN